MRTRRTWRALLMRRILGISLAIFVIGSGVFYLSMYRTAAAPQLYIFMTADKSTVTPGDQIIYDIHFENMGPQVSPKVWINDTLPTGLSYVNDTAYTVGSYNYSILNGNILKWNFAWVPAGNHSFAITVSVSGSVGDGQILRNTAWMNYTSNSFRYQEERNSTATVSVSTPVLHLGNMFVQDALNPSLGDFSLEINNSGSVPSQHLWLNDTLPQGIEYVSYQAPPLVTCTQGVGGAVNCTRDNFGPGVETIVLNVRISASSPPGITLMNWAFLNWTDQDGSMLPPLKASAPLFTKTAVIYPVKMVDQNKALPGSNIHYFIYYNNTGELLATHVWMNDTLPNGVSVVSSSPIPDVNSSGQLEWHMTNVPPGPHAVNVEVALDSALANGTALINQLTFDYFDEIGRKMPRLTRTATTVVSYDIPSIAVVKIANIMTVRPGGQIVYTVFYNNTGSTEARSVTIDDEIPIGVQMLSSDPSFTRIEGSHYIWEFSNVPQGLHQITVTVRVDTSLTEGTTIVNTAAVSYRDRYDQVVGTNFMSVVVEVRTTTSEKGGGLPAWMWPLFVLVIVLTIIAVFLYRAARRGEEAIIDDVFLLHRDGLLIRHFTRKLNPKVDSDILGGMLIAVQNFVNESFASDKGLAKEDGLDQLKFGRYSILLARGKYVVVAAVVSGERIGGKVGEIRAAITEIEKNLGPTLDKWSGDMGQVRSADKYIQDLMAGRYLKRGRS